MTKLFKNGGCVSDDEGDYRAKGFRPRVIHDYLLGRRVIGSALVDKIGKIKGFFSVEKVEK